jgi:hypothetical protein
MLLGDVVKALREANGWGTPQLAERVQACGGRTSYQAIQQLEANPDRTPRYERYLAAAFGKTVEELHSWHHGLPVLGPNYSATALPSDPPSARDASPASAEPAWITSSASHGRLWRALDSAAALSPAMADSLAAMIEAAVATGRAPPPADAVPTHARARQLPRQ